MKRYKILKAIKYAARDWNSGEVVEMPDERAKKYLDEHSIEVVKDSSNKSAPVKEEDKA